MATTAAPIMDVEGYDLENQKGEDEKSRGSRRLRLPESRLGKCCVLFWALLIVWVCALCIRLATANSGGECTPLSEDIVSVEDWDALGGPTLAYADCANPNANEVPFSMVKWVGEHNSYKLLPNFEAIVMGMNMLVGPFQYEKDTLTKQLDRGFRHFELDLHYGTDKNRLMSFHLPALDDESVCYCMEDCFRQIREWQDANPNHLPITVEFEVKQGNLFESWRSTINPPKEDELTNLDRLVRHVWSDARDRVITPDDLRKGQALVSLPEIIETRGWPTVESMRGTVMFAMYSGDWDINEYAGEDREALQGRQAFVFGDVADSMNETAPYVVFTKVDDTAEADVISSTKALVKRGYIVRTRANGVGDTEEDYKENASGAAASNAQLVSMDADVDFVWQKYFGAVQGSAGACDDSSSPDFCATTTIPCPSVLSLGL